MTENLLQKLEEKMMTLLTEVEYSRKDIQRLNHENMSLKIERESYAKKLQDLISLLDSINVTDNTVVNINIATVKPALMQE